LLGRDAAPRGLRGAVFDDIDIETSRGPLRLELTNFRLFNINPVQTGETDDDNELRNFGPNFTFKLRNELGEAQEYENYMSPVELDGRNYYLSGVRSSQADPFQYLYIPADQQGGIERFMQFNAMLYDTERVARVAGRTAGQSVSILESDDDALESTLASSMQQLVGLFAVRGFNGIAEQVSATVPEDQRAEVLDAYLKVLQSLLAGLYAELLTEKGVDLSQGISEADSQFFDDAVNAIAALSRYGATIFVQLGTFEHIQSTGLQIAKAPGKTMVYLGFALLIAGVFCMFYVAANRLWFWVDSVDGRTRLLFAGSGLRHARDFERESSEMQVAVDAELGKLKE